MALKIARLVDATTKAAHGDQPEATPRATSGRNPSRADKVAITAWLSPAYRSSLLQVRAQDSSRTQEDLIAEALNDLFEKYRVATVR